MPGAHSEIGPSNAHRWRPCPGSVEESRGLPDEAGEEAHQGTVFHEFADPVLDLGLDPFTLVGMTLECEDGQVRPFTEEMAQGMLMGIDIVRSYESAPGAVLFVETKVDLSEWLGPGMFGTADVIIIDVENRRLIVFDWKWGAGVPVHPEWNDQAMCYGLGAWSTVAREMFEGVDPATIDVSIIIEQPRAPGGGGKWDTNMAVLLAEGKKIRRDADAVWVEGAPRIPGSKQCQFCPAAKHNTCKARAEHALDLIGTSFDELDEEFDVGAPLRLRKPLAFTPEQRSQLLLHKSMIDNLIADLHASAMRDASQGKPVPGMKRVLGRAGARVWRDPKKAQVVLEAKLEEDVVWTKKLISPAAVEGEVGRKKYREEWERHVFQSEPQPMLVPENDPREALADVDDLFDTIAD